MRRILAVKVFDGAMAEERDAGVTSLTRAAQRSASIRHPNVVDTYEVTFLEGTEQPAILCELVEGTSLAALVERHARAGRRVPLDLALFIATEIAEGLHGARTAITPDGMQLGVAHLDLASREVLLSWNGEVKVSDFGIGNAMRWGSSVRSLRALAARAGGMAPEIARGKPGDTRSDVFSLGVIMREMLVGPRFATTLGEAQALEHAREGFMPTSFLELQLPKEVRAILSRALEVDPSRRFPHATAFAYELRRVAFSMGVGDGRVFLRNALAQQKAQSIDAPRVAYAEDIDDDFEDEIDEDEDGPTIERGRGARDDDEMAEDSIPPDRTSGLIRKANTHEHDDAGDE